jgi:hypothetical protein
MGTFTSATAQVKELNAESVTAIATGFLKRIGHKGRLKPKRVALEEEVYTVEVEMKKLSAIVQVDAKTHEIKAYEIQSKSEEASSLAISPKSVIIFLGVSVGVNVVMYFAFKMFGI